MVKVRYFLVLLTLIGFPIVAEAQNRSIYIEGAATNAEHQAFFLQNFRTEGAGAGYPIAETRAEAAYVFRFQVTPNIITYDDGTQAAPEPDEPQFNIQITLIDNSTSEQVVSFGFQYINLDDMYEFNQFLFLRAVINIPNGFETETVVVVEEVIDDRWQNKWLYLRLSAEFPITFYKLLPEGLHLGNSVYSGTLTNIIDYTPTDNRTVALPAASAGLQIQLLNWLSIEPGIQVVYDHDNRDYSMAANGRLMFGIKSVRNVLLEPYGAFWYPIRYSSDFSSFPKYAIAAGMQMGIQAGSSGVFFIDVNYMYSFEDAVLKNPYGSMYPNPAEIHYHRSSIGLGMGYKIGFFNR